MPIKPLTFQGQKYHLESDHEHKKTPYKLSLLLNSERSPRPASFFPPLAKMFSITITHFFIPRPKALTKLKTTLFKDPQINEHSHDEQAADSQEEETGEAQIEFDEGDSDKENTTCRTVSNEKGSKGESHDSHDSDQPSK